jgi:apolipoprotein N-acyltransferase
MYKNTTFSFTPNSKIVDLSTSIILKLLLALLSGFLLSLAFLDHDYFYCAWLGFIPLLLAIDKASLIQSYLLGLIAGLTMFTISAYWIVDFIALSKDYGVRSGFLLSGLYWFYSAHSVALAILLFNGLRQYSRVHEFLLFPLILVIFSSTFPMLFSIRLGDTQVNFHIALQAIEFVGVQGLDFIILLFNILIYRILVNAFSVHSKDSQPSKLPMLVSTLLIGSWFLYGTISYSFWQEKIAKWDTLKVGIVQMNEIPKLGDRVQYPGYSQTYPPEMEMTERLSSAGAEIIIWPEAQSKKYLNNHTVKRAYQHNMSLLNKDLVFQDFEHIRDPISGNIIEKYNTAIMINGNGQQVGSYQKMKRIPFGEYVPVFEKDSTPSKWVENFFGDFTSGLSEGEEHQVFKHSKINIIPLICYETTFPEFVGEAVQHTLAQRNLAVGTLLVGLSNDGWFGSTHLPYQHIMPSVLRAVENRLPLVHVANNGPSIVAIPDGSVIFTSAFQQSAGYIVDIPHSSAEQGSFYSRHPSLFNNIIKFIFVLTLLAALKEWRYRAKQSTATFVTNR